MHDICDCGITISIKGIIQRDCKILVVRDRHGNYDLPGGRSNCCESIADTLVRELREELGVVPSSCEERPHFAFSWKNELRKTHGVVIGFNVNLEAGELHATEEDQIVEHKWVTASELIQLPMPDAWREAYRKVFMA